MKNVSILTVLFCLLIHISSPAQDQEFIMPSLDVGKNIQEIEFKEDGTYPGISTSYMIGTTENDTLRFPVKAIGFDLIPFKVMVISPDPAQNLTVILVKNHWQDIAKTGTTNQGLFEDEFRTAERFGIMIVGAKPGIPFRLGVYKGPVIKRTSPLFIPAADFREGKFNNSGGGNSPNNIDGQKSNETTGGKSLVWVIGIAANVIIGLLVFIIVNNKRAKSKALLVLFFLASSHLLLCSFGKRVGREAFVQGVKDMGGKLSETFNQGGDLADFAGKVGEVARGGLDFKNLTEYDSVFEPDMDPNGQPSLPSSCLSASPSSSPETNPGNNRSKKPNETSNDDLNDRDNKYDKKPPNSSGTGPVMGEVIPGGASPRNVLIAPTYDKNGNLISAGDYPNAPTKVGIDPVTGKPILPVFAGRDIVTRGGTDPVTGEPVPPVFAGGDVVFRAPKYDKDGRLIDAGDDPNAPTRVPVDPETGELLITDHTPRYSPSGEKPDASSSSKSKASNERSVNNSNSRNRTDQDEKKNNSEGCQCLKQAYEELEETRYKFEKLAVILNSTSKFTTASIAFGDDVSGIHAVSGLAWQAERKKIVKSYEIFQKAYDDKYKELVEKLYDNLKKVDKCEQKLGFENWYSIAGFMYYEFAKARYHRNGK